MFNFWLNMLFPPKGCQHREVSQIQSVLVCSECFECLTAQPLGSTLESSKGKGVTFRLFILFAAGELRSIGKSKNLDDSILRAIEIVKKEGRPFSDKTMEWSLKSARELVSKRENGIA